MIDFVGLHINTGHFPVLRARQILNNIVNQRKDALTERIGTHGHGHNASVAHIGTKRSTDLRVRESFTVKVTFHHFFACLGYGFHQHIPV